MAVRENITRDEAQARARVFRDVHYDVLLYTLPAAAILAGVALVLFYHHKTVPELVAIFAGLFLLISATSLASLHYIFKLKLGRIEMVRYTGEGPPEP